MDEAQTLQMQEQTAQYYETKLRADPTIKATEDMAQWATAKFGNSSFP